MPRFFRGRVCDRVRPPQRNAVSGARRHAPRDVRVSYEMVRQYSVIVPVRIAAASPPAGQVAAALK